MKDFLNKVRKEILQNMISDIVEVIGESIIIKPLPHLFFLIVVHWRAIKQTT